MKKNETDAYQRHVEEASGDYTVPVNRKLNFLAALLTLLIAIGLWFYVVHGSNANIRETIDLVPIEKQGVTELAKNGYTVGSMSIDRINLTLIGTRSALEKVNVDNVKAYIDFSELTLEEVSKRDKHVLPIHVDLPSGIALDGSPGSVTVVMEKTISASLPVSAGDISLTSFVLDTDCRIDLSTSLLNVDRVRITGPASTVMQIQKIAFVTNATVTLATSSNVSLSPVYLDASGERVTVDPDTFTAICYRGDDVVDTVSVALTLLKDKVLPLSVYDRDGILGADKIMLDPPRVVVTGLPAAVDALSALELGSFSARNLSTEQGERVSLSFALRDLPAGILSVASENGEPFGAEGVRATAQIDAGKVYRLHVPASYVQLLGGRAVLVDDGFDIALRTLGDDTYFLLLEENIRQGKGGITLVVNLTDINPGVQIKAPLTVVFSAEFEGRIYEVYEKGAPYTATVRTGE